MDVIITAEQLRHRLRDADAPLVLDIRWSLEVPNGRPEYLAGHIPGAVWVSLDDDLASHGQPTDGRHPLPTREHLEAAARTWGLKDGDSVVVYDAGPGYAAARAWWLLRHAGVSVRILDGGLPAWTAAGGELEAGDVAREAGDVHLDWGRMSVVDATAAASVASVGVLMDARAAERYRGDVEPLDPQAGHIPGAISMPTLNNVGPDGRFLPASQLAQRFASLGDGPLAVYCGSGVSAAQVIAALAMVGREAALYPGSWSQWSNLGLPVETA